MSKKSVLETESSEVKIKMKTRTNLLQGSILKALVSMAVPIMATSLLQMAYNMTDMIWIGRVGSNSVAAVGAAGMFVNLANGFGAFLRVGGQVNVAHSYGAGNKTRAAQVARNALQMGAVISLIYGLIVCLFRKPFIGFFKFTNQQVIKDAELYLLIMGAFIFFNFINPICTAVITATGNSKTPFKISTVGLVINLILDPMLIFGIGFFPALGVFGAAIATIFAQFIVFVLYMNYMRNDEQVFSKMKFGKPLEKDIMADITRIGLPSTIQGVMFTGISMTIGRIIAAWGETAIAVQKVGIQVESISYMAADGFAAATNSFIAQNYGAKQYDRSKKGYTTALKVMLGWGVVTTCILVFLPAPIFSVFITEPDVIPLGVDYLRILGYSQLFMCIEILTSGAFSAYGKTLPPSIVSIIFTGMRIPMAILLGKTALGLNGVWWSISLSSVFKGTILVTLFILFMRKFNKRIQQEAAEQHK